MELFKRLRWEYEHGLGTIRGVAQKYRVHRRTVRAALKNPVPSKRKVVQRDRPKMAPLIPFIDAILETDLKAPWNHGHTAHQIWSRIRAEFLSDVSESTIRKYVRIRKIQSASSKEQTAQLAATWMLEVLQSGDPVSLLEKGILSGTALSSLAQFIKGGRLRERRKALVIFSCLKGIPTSVIVRSLHISRKTIRRYFDRFEREGPNAVLATRTTKTKDFCTQIQIHGCLWENR